MDLFVCFLFATIVTLPDLYSIYKNRKTWVPVNCPPFAIGDDHHYFTEISELHKKILGLPGGLDTLTGVMKITVSSLLINLPFYHLGYLIGDRRYGVLSVRFFNAFFLFLSLLIFFKVLSAANGLPLSDVSIYFLSVSVFITFPFYLFSWEILGSVFFNIKNKKHIFNRSSANELLRAVQMSTTAPLLLLSAAYMIYVFSGNFSYWDLLFLFFINLFLLFSYPPLGLGYFFLISGSFGFSWLNGEIDFAFLTASVLIFTAVNFAAVKRQLKMIHSCPMTSEVFGNSHFKQSIKLKLLLRPFVIITMSFIVLMFVYSLSGYTAMIFILISLFSLPMGLAVHQGDRFWLRGFLIIYSSIFFFILFAALSLAVTDIDMAALSALAVLAAVLTGYFYNNAKYLYENYERRAYTLHALDIALDQSEYPQNIATDSIELSFFIQLYSAKDVMLKHFSLQNNGFEKNIADFVANFKKCGYSSEEIKAIFEKTYSYEDWIIERGADAFFDKVYMNKTYKHTLSFMATYKDFNNKLLNSTFVDENKSYNHLFLHLVDTSFSETNQNFDKYIPIKIKYINLDQRDLL